MKFFSRIFFCTSFFLYATAQVAFARSGNEVPRCVSTQGSRFSQHITRAQVIGEAPPPRRIFPLYPFRTANPIQKVVSTLEVSGVETFLWDLDATLSFQHINAKDVAITLQSPQGTVVTLTSGNGGRLTGHVFDDVVWDDAADKEESFSSFLATDFAASGVTDPYRLSPEEPLGAFIGEDPNGRWTLTIQGIDFSRVETADWSLDLMTTSSPGESRVRYLRERLGRTPESRITDRGEISSTISLLDGGSIVDLILFTDISHESNGDLIITLTSPEGTVVTLSSGNGGSAQDVFTGTLWSDRADPLGYLEKPSLNFRVTDYPYVSGDRASSLTPEEAFAAFRGENPNGDWTLKVEDRERNGLEGYLEAWRLEIATTCPEVNLSASIVDTVSLVAPGGQIPCTVIVENDPSFNEAPETELTFALPTGTTLANSVIPFGWECEEAQNAGQPIVLCRSSFFEPSSQIFVFFLDVDSNLASNVTLPLEVSIHSPIAYEMVPENNHDERTVTVYINATESDTDGDGVLDSVDCFPLDATRTCSTGLPDQNTNPTDSDQDGVPDDLERRFNTDPADADTDDDGLSDAEEITGITYQGGRGPLDPDVDADGVLDGADNCPVVANANQADADSNGVGDACQDDLDGDLVMDAQDNCPFIANRDQLDQDRDGIGNSCDPDFSQSAVESCSCRMTGTASPSKGQMVPFFLTIFSLFSLRAYRSRSS